MKYLHQHRGFTLIEMVIAITILSIMMILAYATLRTGSNSWAAVNVVHDEIEEFRVAHRFLRRQIAQARLQAMPAAEEAEPLFVGNPNELDFVAPLSIRQTVSPLYRFRLRFEPSAEGTRLLLEYAPYIADTSGTDDAAKTDSTVLATGLVEGNLMYFGSETVGGEREWMDEWSIPDRLPLLVKVRMNGDQRKRWPELVVPVYRAGG